MKVSFSLVLVAGLELEETFQALEYRSLYCIH